MVILPNYRVASITPEFDLKNKGDVEVIFSKKGSNYHTTIISIDVGLENFCPLLGAVVVVARYSPKDDYGLCSVEH